MILIKRSHLQVTDYQWNDSRSLEFKFSVYNLGTREYEYKAMDWNGETKTLYLPRGMDIRMVETLTRSKAVIDKSCDEWDKIGKVMIKYLPKNEIQQKTIRFILGLGDYDYTAGYSQLSINLMTGKGKTYVAIASMAYEETRFMVITSIRGWLQQWAEKALEYTDFTPKNILNLTAPVITKILAGKLDLSGIKMVTSTHSTLGDYASKHGWDKIDLLFNALRIKYKIFDEAHLYFDSMSMIDFHSNTYKTLYLTASPYRSDDKENEIYRRYFEMVPSIELFDKERDAVTQYISVHFNSHPTPAEIMHCMNKYGLIKARYIDYIIKRDCFWKLLYCCFFEAVVPNPGRTLMLTETNNVIPILKDWIESEFPEYRGHIGTFHGDSKPQERAEAKQQWIVITNRMCGGTCMDIPDLGLCFPVLVPTKSKVITHQLFGRVGREGTTLTKFIYLDIVDEGFKKLKEFYSYRLPVFMKYATSCSRVIYKDNDLNAQFEKYYKEQQADWPFTIKL